MPDDYTPLPGEIWLLEHWEWAQRYNFQWVVAAGEEYRDHDADLNRLIARVAEAGRLEGAVFAFVDHPQFLGGRS